VGYRLSIPPEVVSQILSASSYLESVRDGLGTELEKEVEIVLQSISQNPNLYPREFGPVRRALIRRFKQVIFYTLRGDTILVLELRDARREPPDWEERGYRRQ
jgi:toxin ParE1/3/4